MGKQRTRPTPSNEQEQFNDIAQSQNNETKIQTHNVKNNIVIEHRLRPAPTTRQVKRRCDLRVSRKLCVSYLFFSLSQFFEFEFVSVLRPLHHLNTFEWMNTRAVVDVVGLRVCVCVCSCLREKELLKCNRPCFHGTLGTRTNTSVPTEMLTIW